MFYFLGVLFHMVGGVAAGSFYLPYKKVKEWSWENYWMAGGLFSWIIIPFLAAAITIPNFLEIIYDNPDYLIWPIIFGLLWGIGGLTYGLAMRYLGISLGNSVILGFSSVLGALLPAIYYDFKGDHTHSFSHMLATPGGKMVLLGIAICVLGIAISGRAGVLKERAIKTVKGSEEFQLKKGLLLAILSGTLSSCFNYGIEAGRPLAALAFKNGSLELFQNNITFLVVLWGGFITNALYCIYLFVRNKSFGEYSDTNRPLIKNYIFSALAGATWFLQFFFYGMGESRLGNGAGSWILHMSTIIVVGNLWGLYLNEWKGSSVKAKYTMAAGVFILLLSVIIVGYGSAI